MNRFHILLGSIAASVATVVGVIIVADPSPAPADPFYGLHLSAPEELDEYADDEVLGSPTVSYQSDSFEYKISYPGSWELDTSSTEFAGHILTDPLERVIITITETKDMKLQTAAGINDVMKSLTESLKYDPSFTLQKVQQFLWHGHQTIFTEGVRVIGGQQYHTREYNIVRADHSSMLNLSITTNTKSEDLYDTPIEDILNSLEVCHDIKTTEN